MQCSTVQNTLTMPSSLHIQLNYIIFSDSSSEGFVKATKVNTVGVNKQSEIAQLRTYSVKDRFSNES